MSEEQKTQQTSNNFDDGNKPEADSLVERANSAAERLEAATKKNEELLKKMEAIETRRVLSGKTEAGITEIKKEETAAEYAARILRGGK